MVGLAVSPRRVVRNWSARRLRNAFKEALKRRGLDEHGRANVEPGGIANPPTIRGYLRLQGSQRILAVDNDKLRYECLKVLDEIIRSNNHPAEVGDRRSSYDGTRARLGLKGT